MESNKYAHVRHAQQTRPHTCHWPGCDKQVPPARWGCTVHWYKLPLSIRNRIWAAYRLGQEESGDVSPEYLAAAQTAQEWIKRQQAL